MVTKGKTVVGAGQKAEAKAKGEGEVEDAGVANLAVIIRAGVVPSMRVGLQGIPVAMLAVGEHASSISGVVASMAVRAHSRTLPPLLVRRAKRRLGPLVLLAEEAVPNV